MNNLIVYLEIEDGIVSDVSLELLTKGRSLADQLKCRLEAVAIGYQLDKIAEQVFPYGVDVLYLADDKRLSPYTTLPHTSVLVNLFKEEKPQIAFMGATSVGRDLGPRVSSALYSGLLPTVLPSKSELTKTKKPEKNTKICFIRSGRIRWKHRGNYRKPGLPSADGHRARRCDEKRNP